MRSYSKRHDLLYDLVEALRQLGTAREAAGLDGKRRSVRSTGRVGHVHNVEDRLGEETVCKIIDDYRAGVTGQELADRYEVSLSSVRRMLRKHGGRLRDL